MKKGFKQSLAVILSAVLLLTMLPFTASAATATPDSVGVESGTTGDCTWTLEDNVLTISGNGAMGNYNSYNSFAPWRNSEFSQAVIENGVTNIGNYAFNDRRKLASVTIPNSVTSIGDSAFYGCSSLASITIPDSVTSIGSKAFSGCSSLASITIPDSVTSIGSIAFDGCTRLTNITVDTYNTTYRSIDGNLYNKNATTLIRYAPGKTATTFTIPYSVTSIGHEAFYGCSSLDSVTIPDSVTSIGNNAFYGCIKLASVTIPYSVTSIGSAAFYGCSSLASVNIPNSVTSIGDYAFYGCSSLASVNIPNSVTSICYYAFYGCIKLASVNITDSVTSIGDSAFSGCSSLSSVNIPDSVTSIGNYAFLNCSSLSSVNIPDSVSSIGDSAFSGCSNLASVTIPDSVKSISYGAFRGCSSLASVTIPDSVTSIGNYAFLNCSSLINITVDANNTTYCSIDGNLYNKNATALIRYAPGKTTTTFTIPNSVTSIGDSAFSDCRRLASVNIPNSFTSIGDYAFCGCNSLASVNIPNSVMSIGNSAFSGCSSLSSVNIPNSVTSIGNNAFSGCSSLASVNIPNSVTSIGDYAFYGCNSLASVNIPDSVASIGRLAFGYRYGQKIDNFTIIGYRGSAAETYANNNQFIFIAIENASVFQYQILSDDTAEITKYSGNGGEIFIPSELNGHTVTSIGNEAFSNCSSLTAVGIPYSVTSIDFSAFNGCSSLTNITVDTNNTAYSSIDGNLYNKNATALIRYAPGKTTTTFTIRYSVTSIGNHAFNGCSNLVSVVIPNSITSIGKYAFENCSSLSSVVIPNSITSIDIFAFNGCNSLTLVTIPNTVTTIGDKAFGYNGSEKTDNFTIIGYQGSAAENFANDNDFTFLTLEDSSAYQYQILSNGTAEIKNYTGNGGAICIPSKLDGHTVTGIGKNAFRGCSSLSSVSIPDSVKSIGNYAFLNCSSLSSVIISNSVIGIGEGAFKDCSSLTNITVDANNTTYCSIAGNLYNKNATTLIQYAIGKTATTFTIPDSVTSIGNHAFDGCSSLSSVTISDSVTSIDYEAFLRCTSLTSVIIPKTVTSIGYWAFGYNESDKIENFTIIGSKGSAAETYAKNNGFIFTEGPSVYQYQLLADGTAEITQYTGNGGDIMIPSELDGHTVTIIGNEAFSNCSSLTAVSIPNSVIKISNTAFSDCNSLSGIQVDSNNTAFCSIDGNLYNKTATTLIQYATGKTAESFSIPNSVNVIGDNAFRKCTGLTTVSIPNSVTEIGYKAFSGCSNLTDATIPYSVTTIGSNAFYGCSKLTDVIIPDSVTTIGQNAFKNCSGLTSVTIPQSVTTIGKLAFGYDGSDKTDNFAVIGYRGSAAETYANNNNFIFYSIEDPSAFRYDILDNGTVKISEYIGNGGNLIIPSVINGYPVTSISDNAFLNCIDVTAVIIPDSVTSIGNWAFYNCIEMNEIIMPDSVTSIGDAAFLNCKCLTTVTIPSSVKIINKWTFKDCDNLKDITIPNTVESISDLAFMNCTSLTSITIPDSVNNIGIGSFFGCSGLTSVVISNSITNISNYTFYNCSSLSSVVIPDSVTTIGSCAFDLCNSLTSVTIPNSVKIIGNYAFDQCDNLETVSIGNSVTNISNNAFDQCTKLNNFTVDSNNTEFYSIDGNLYDKNATKLIRYAMGKTDTSFTIPNTVTTIGENAFYGCSSLTSVTIPHSVTEICNNAFYKSNLTSLTIPDSVTTIGNGTFSDCKHLASVTIPNSVNSIGNNAFSNCSSLTSVIIPDSVTNISQEMFSNCEEMTSVTIPNSVTNIGNSAFINCKNLNSVTIPNSVISIGNEAFRNCNLFTSINIPNSVTNIGKGSFVDCKNITSVTIPKSVTDIGRKAFGYYWDGSNYQKIDNFIIYGYSNSTAATYANEDENQFIFRAIDFIWGEDNWNFNNYSNVPIYINNEVYNNIFKKVIEQFGINNNIEIENLKTAKTSNGSCFGMTLTEILVKQNLLNLSDYYCNPVVNQNNLNDTYTKPLINAVHRLQHASKNIGQAKKEAAFLKQLKTQSQFIQKLEETFDDHQTYVMISYRIFYDRYGNGNKIEHSNHAVLAYDIETLKNEFIFNGKKYDKRVLICDPNHSGDNKVNDDCCIYYSSDDYSWVIPYQCKNDLSYKSMCYWNANSPNNNTGSIEFIMKFDTINTCSNLLSDSSINKKLLSGLEIDSNNGYIISMIDNNGNPIADDDNENIAQYYMDLDDTIPKSDPYDYYALRNPNAGYRISFSNSSTANTFMEYENIAYDFDATNVSSVTYQPNGSIQLNSTGSTYSMNYSIKMITNDCECVTKDWYALTVKGSNADQVTLELDKERGGYILSSSSGLGTVTLKANNSDKSVSRTFSTNTDRVFIYEIDENMIGVSVASSDSLTEIPFNIGDVNCDGLINVRDVTAIQRYGVDLQELSERQLALADVDGDDAVTINDATHIQRYLAEFDNVILGKQNQ